MVDMKIKEDSSEIVPYDEINIPICITEGYLSHYPNYRTLCHWHEDLEFIAVLDGSMEYYVNGKNIFLQKGDILAINSGRLHYGYSTLKNECHFYCIIFHPSLIATNPYLVQKYIVAVTESDREDFILYKNENSMFVLLETIYRTKKEGSPGFELEVLGLFQNLWKRIYVDITAESVHRDTASGMEVISQRKMVSYIYQNYGENLTLDEIASKGNVCRSKCCQIFKKYMGKSPMDFVNAYRLECSQKLLLTTSRSITDICTACGFNHLSYFSRQFQMKFGCTPKKYRQCGGRIQDLP